MKKTIKTVVVDVEAFVGKNQKTVKFELAGDATPQDVGRKVLELCDGEYTNESIRVGLQDESGTLAGWYRGNIVTAGENPWFKVTEQINAGVYTGIRYVWKPNV